MLLYIILYNESDGVIIVHRTQLYLDEVRYQYVASIAKQQGISIAEVFRKLIDAHFHSTSQFNNKDPFFNVVGIGRGTGDRVAENYEDYLYGNT